MLLKRKHGKIWKRWCYWRFDTKQFWLDCRTFLTQMMKEVFERSPLKQTIVQYCRIFHLKVIASYSKEATKNALKSLNTFQHLDMFYFQTSVNITKYTSLSSMLKFVCIRSHGQVLSREALVLGMWFLKKI